MYVCCYGLSEYNKQYTNQLVDCGCIEGDRTELIRQIKSDKKFCRDEGAIGYRCFVNSLINDTFLYIKNENNEILGACTLNLGEYIILYGICVPDNRIIGIGTLLLNNLKSIGKLINATQITLSASESVQGFYEKNGFTFNKLDDEDEVEDEGEEGAGMYYYFKQPSETIGGTKNITSQKKAKRGTIKAKRGTKNITSQKKQKEEQKKQKEENLIKENKQNIKI